MQVVLHEGQSPQEGQAIAEGLMNKLNIQAPDLISGSYIDMISNNKLQECWMDPSAECYMPNLS